MNYYFVMLLVITAITVGFVGVGIKKDYIRKAAMSVPAILLAIGLIFIFYL